MTFKNFNQTNDIKLINIAKELVDYQPITVKEDKYYKRISKDDILEICMKNKAIINGIKNKSSLDIDDYKELLTAIGFTIRDYLTKKFDVYCKRISDNCIGYDFVLENNLPLIDVVMGACESKWNWYLQTSKGRVILVKFKDNKKGERIKFRGKGANINITDCKCFQIGKAKIIVCDLTKTVYCLSADNEFLFVVKGADNKYNCIA